MSAPCPFCGDTRAPNTDEVFKDAEGGLFAAVCQCCGAQSGPVGTRGAALILWDERFAPGETAKFHDLFNKISPS